MERFLVEYLINSIWQAPLLAAAAWLILRATRPSPIAQHRIWIATLALMLALPLLTRTAGAALPSPARPTASSGATIGDLIAPTPTVLPPPSVDRVEISQPADSIPAAVPRPLNTRKRPAAWLPTREFKLGPLATRWLVGLYLAITAFMAVRLLGSWWMALRVVARATPAALNDPASSLLNKCCERLGVTQPKVLVSSSTSSPMLVGIIRPALLLPEGFAAHLEDPATSGDNDVAHTIEAVWLHELAHLRRRDYLANLVCRIAALPIAYHPATRAVQQRIRRTREMVCDSIAAADMESPHSYARCLLGLARTMRGAATQFEAVGILDRGTLEERIMQLITAKPTVSMRMRAIRLTACAAIALAVVAAATTLHLTPAMAQASAGIPPSTSLAPAAPAAAAAPAATPTPATTRAQPRTAVRPAPAAQPPKSAGPSTPTPAEMDDLRIRYDYAMKMYDAVVARQADLIAHGDTAAASSADLKEQLNDARAQYENLSIVMEDAVQKHNEALAKRDAYLESLARDTQQQATVEAQRRGQQQALAEVQQALQAQTARQQTHQAQLKAQAAQDQQLELFAREKQELEAMEDLHDSEISQIQEALVRLNDPEVKKQIDSITGAELRKQMSDAAKQIDSVTIAERQLTEALAKLNNPEIKKQIDGITSADIQKQLSDAAQQLVVYQARLAQLQQQIQQQQEMLRNHPAPQSVPPAPAKAP